MILSSLSRRAAVRISTCLARCGSKSTTRQTTAVVGVVSRSFVSRTLPLLDDDLPYHIVVGMPALSPTMEAGALAEWYVKEGDSFTAGESLAKIETDKASIDFEAQDDGYVAKLLAEAGGDDIVVGTPIMVTVEEEEDVGAFANYVAPEAAAPAPAKEEATPAPPPPPPPPAPKEEAPPAPVAAAAAEATPPPPPPPPPAAAAAPPPPPPPPAAAAPVTSGWGSLALVNSPLVGTLSKQQKAYVEKYGTTGQIPL